MNTKIKHKLSLDNVLKLIEFINNEDSNFLFEDSPRKKRTNKTIKRKSVRIQGEGITTDLNLIKIFIN